MSIRLPYGKQFIDEADIAAVVEVLRGNWLTCGPTVEAFEAALAKHTGAPHAIAVNSGTAALHMAAMACGMGPGDWAVVPAITFAATANAVRYCGASVQFADVDPATGLMTPATLRAALDEAERLGRKVKAVLPVHLAGQCVDLPAMAAIAQERGLTVIDDACHALGGRWGDTRVGEGGHSAATIFSFHPVKTVAMGEGGAVTTPCGEMAARLRLLRSHGITRDPSRFQNPALALDAQGKPNPWYYEAVELGYNYRISDINCALGLSQLAKLDGFVSRRAEIVALYDRLLAGLAPTIRPLGRMPGQRPAWHLYVVRMDFAALGRDRAEVMRFLAERGIGTQVHYIPVPWQPTYAGSPGTEAPLPGAEAYYGAVLSLPLYPSLTDDDVAEVVAALKDLLS